MTKMTRAGYVAAGLLLTMILGAASLHVRYGSGLAPLTFIATAYALGVGVWFVLASLRLRLRPEVVGVGAMAFGAAWIATGAEFNWVFWLVAVPASGALAARLPPARRRTRSIRSSNL
jgi:hypothetical protein